MNADSAKLAQEVAFAPNVVEGTFEFQGETYNFKATPKQEAKMNDQHRATAGEWASVKSCANDVVTYSTILELLHRIEALEAAQQAQPNHPEKPDSSLVEWVALVIKNGIACDREPERVAPDVIRAVTAWLTGNPNHHFPPALVFALEQEANR